MGGDPERPGVGREVADFLARARQATLATTGPAGRPRLVPVCFVVIDDGGPAGLRIYTPVDEKPKRHADPHALARVRDIAARPGVTLLVDRWDEDWSRLGWVRLDARAVILEPGADADSEERATAIRALRAKYPQYRAHALEARPLIRAGVDRLTAWGRLEDAEH